MDHEKMNLDTLDEIIKDLDESNDARRKMINEALDAMKRTVVLLEDYYALTLGVHSTVRRRVSDLHEALDPKP